MTLAEVIAAVPALLGHYPVESVVMVFVAGRCSAGGPAIWRVVRPRMATLRTITA